MWHSSHLKFNFDDKICNVTKRMCGTVKRKPQIDIETFIHQLPDFGAGIDFAQQCSF